MMSKITSDVNRLVGLSFLILAYSVLFAGYALAQKPSSREGELARALWECCMQKKFPNSEFATGTFTGYDPDSHRNFAWDPKRHAWIDTKTLEVVCGGSQRELGRVLWECCIQKKFPNSEFATGTLTGYDPDSHRNFAWDKDKQAWIDTKTLECICPVCPAGQPQEKKVIEEKKEACDIEFGYDYMRAPDESPKNLNGLGGSLFCNAKRWIGIGGDFSALFGSTTETVGTTSIDVSLHRQTYLFGPQFNFYPNDKVKLFVHPLFGGVHDTTKTTIGTTTTSFSANAFAMDFGGGVDVNLNDRIAIRPFQFDYLRTHFGGDWQNNYRISAGLVIRLGKKK